MIYEAEGEELSHYTNEDNFKDMLRAHAKKMGIRPFVFGEQLALQQMGGKSSRKANTAGPHQVTEEELELHW